jgi:CBS-domain-containing membrane protein
VANETYLRRAASSIGAVLAMTEARRASDLFQPLVNFNLADTKEASEQVTRTCRERAQKRALAWYEKCWGGGSQIPPGMSFDETLWTIFGVCIGLLTVSLINKLFQSSSGQSIVLGPFGALMTLQYGLSGAPASQPRNVVLGHVIAIAVSLGFTYITAMPTWIRQVVAPALSIGIMAKLGITHPPAGAQCVIFAEGGHGWTSYALVILCSVISLIPATLINNMSQKRQYPTYWGYIPAYLSRTCSRVSRKTKESI